MGIRILMLVTVCVLLAGCGGGSAKTLTVSQGASSTQGTASMPPSRQDELDAFLAQVKPLRQTLDQQVIAARKAIKAYQANPTSSTARTSGDTLTKAGKKILADYLKMAAIVPPNAVKSAWTGYADSLFGVAVKFAGSDLKTQDVAAASSDLQPLQAAGAEITRFKTALIQYAAANQVQLPSWVNHIGTG
jgi:hypothetical protein